MSESNEATRAVTRRTRKAAPERLPCLEILNGAQAGALIWLPPDCTVGRVEGCDLVLDDDSVSRRHARFFEREGRTWVEDLGSTNGVMMGLEEVHEARALLDGDMLSIGSVEVRFALYSQSQIALAAQPGLMLTSTVARDQFWGWLQLELTQAHDGEFEMVIEERSTLVLTEVPLRRALAMAERLANRPVSNNSPDICVSLYRGARPTTARWTCVPVRDKLRQEELARLENLPARVAHELNTPLVAVSMAVEMAAERLENPEKVSGLLGRALSSIEQMRQAIKNLSQQTEWGE